MNELESDWYDHPRDGMGIGQFLDSTWEMYGGKPTDVTEQVRIGLRYMRERYGNGSDKGGATA